nr:chloride channel protein [Flavobacterium sp.]
MFKNYLYQLENLIAWSRDKITNKQFIFLSSVLVGISAAIAVIALKTFAHSIFTFATYVTNITSIFKYGFIKGMLPVIGILLTVFVIKKFLGGSIEKGTSHILYAVAKKASIIPRKHMYAKI